jgi:hypothetical protein
MTSILLFLSAWLDKRSEERAKQREHELDLRRLENEQIRESSVCESCEALKIELARLHDQNNLLINRMTTPNEVPIKQESDEVLKPIMPRHQSWKMRQQTLEANDRHNAKLINDKVKEELKIRERDKPAPEIVVLTEPITVESIEKELGVTDADESVSRAS